MGNKETFIVDSSTLLKKSKVWGTPASSVHKTGKYHHRSPIADRHGSQGSYDINGNHPSDDAVLGSGVPTTVSEDCDHVTIASDMSGLTPASHLYTPTPPHLFPPPTKHQRNDQPSQPDLAAGGSTKSPLASSQGGSHQLGSNTPPQHRTSRHQWPPPPPKTQHHQPHCTSPQMHIRVSSTSPTPLRSSTPNQENNLNEKWRDRRSKRGDFFSKPHRSNGMSPSNTHSNEESIVTPPRWKQKGAMLTIDTGTSKRNSSLKDRRSKAKPPQNPPSALQLQAMATASHVTRQNHDCTNSHNQPGMPESKSAPTTTSIGSYTTNPSSTRPDILDADTLEHQSYSSDKENNNKPITTDLVPVDGDISPIQQRITAWNQLGYQHNRKPEELQKQQMKKDVLRDDSMSQDSQGHENDIRSSIKNYGNLNKEENHEHRENQTANHHVSYQTVSQRDKTNPSHQKRCCNSSLPASSLEQVNNPVASTHDEYNDALSSSQTEGGDITTASPMSHNSLEHPSPVAAAAADAAAELVRRGGESPKAAAAFLAAIQSGCRNQNQDGVGMLDQNDIVGLARDGGVETTYKVNSNMPLRHHGNISQGRELANNKISNTGAANSIGNGVRTTNVKEQGIDNNCERLGEEDRSQADLVSSQNTTNVAIIADAVVRDHPPNLTNVENQVQASLHEMEVRMEARMLRLEARLEAQLKARLEYMEAKMDARMDEIQSILKLMVTSGAGGGGGSSRGGGSLDEDYEV